LTTSTSRITNPSVISSSSSARNAATSTRCPGPAAAAAAPLPLVRLVAGLHHRQVGLHALGDGLDTRSGDGRLVFPVFAALADLVRDGRATGAQDGRAAARAAGQRLGRPPSLTPEQSGTPGGCC
jgi:resolvase-like protein